MISRKLYTLAIGFVLCFGSVQAQQQIQLFPFSGATNTKCPYDTSVATLEFPDWEVYQTTNGKWDGPRDSTFCYSLATSTGSFQGNLAGDSMTVGVPVFIRAKFDSTNKVALDSHKLYRFNADFYGATQVNTMLGDTCPDGACSGVRVGIEIPDSAGTGTDIRWYDHSMKFTNNAPTDFCVATEKFDGENFLREVIFKLTLSAPTSGMGYTFNQPWMEIPLFGVTKIREIKATNFWQGYYNWTPNQGLQSNALVIHDDTAGYPNANNIHYVEAAPSPNTSQVDTVRLQLYGGLFFQPYSALRGAQIVGDTLRHKLKIENYQADVCFPDVVELMFYNGEGYKHLGGNLSFEGMSCMMFRHGAKLEVGDGITLNYGKPGKGVLALRGGSIHLGKNSTLNIGCLMMIGEDMEYPELRDVHVYLNRGAHLEFQPGSVLKNDLSPTGLTRLIVHIRGGTLDDLSLTEKERALIIRKYEDPYLDFAQNLNIHQNPTQESLVFSWIAEGESSHEVELLGLEGKVIRQENLQMGEGLNYFEWNLTNVQPGVYFLRLKSEAKAATKKVVVY